MLTMHSSSGGQSEANALYLDIDLYESFHLPLFEEKIIKMGLPEQLQCHKCLYRHYNPESQRLFSEKINE